MTHALNDAALAQLFGDARTHNFWLDKPVSDALLQSVYDQVKWAPTSANCSPARFTFIKSPEAKARLKPALSEGNREKTMNAPVTVIVSADFAFYDKLPELFPHTDARSWFVGNPALIESTAKRNSVL